MGLSSANKGRARNVCFTKRRKRLFKKAAELGVLFPEVRIAAVVFSPAGNLYVFCDVSEMEKLLAMDEPSALLTEETENGEEENAHSSPVVEITLQEITGDFDGLDEEGFINQFLNF
ncbi:PREDICTED: MADS-box transcription factor 15-like [Ipomoea nil]|uniref:MADS-box transcription factor 15-like n=1 Tax=Ipomoea nil TaxID=35883 RepID=UPI0009010B61|nr:PREDICTED: MADS-box transcription factor 15-like [Ipomoea nil]